MGKEASGGREELNVEQKTIGLYIFFSAVFCVDVLSPESPISCLSHQLANFKCRCSNFVLLDS